MREEWLDEIFDDDGQRERLYGIEKAATDAIQKAIELKRRVAMSWEKFL